MSKLTPRAEYLDQQLRASAWHTLLTRINNATVSSILWNALPPNRADSNDEWEHLRLITLGLVLVPGCGLVCRGKLAQFLRENDPQNIQNPPP